MIVVMFVDVICRYVTIPTTKSRKLRKISEWSGEDDGR